MRSMIKVLFLVVVPQVLAPGGPLSLGTVSRAQPNALAAAGGNPVAGLPVFFVKNIGQTDPSIQYYVDAPEMRAGFANDSVVFQKHGKQIRMRFAGADPDVTIRGNDLMSGSAHFLLGDRSVRSAKGASLYHQILYRELYPGIDLSYSPSGATIKSEFVVRPGSNPAVIHLQYPDDSRISVDPSGNLLIWDGTTLLHENAPTLCQKIKGKHVPVFEIGRAS